MTVCEVQMIEGTKVTLSSSLGKIERVVVRDLGDVVCVCREDEYVQAQKEAREPVTVGFPKKDVLCFP